MTTKKLTGAGGLFGSGEPKDVNDNLFSVDIVEAILGVSEGPIKGLANGPQSFLIGDTPLQSVDGSNNFGSFELVVRKGSELGETITSRMGGFGSSTSVGTNLAYNTSVVRSGLHTNINFIDIRLVISRLLLTNDDGTFENTGVIRVEYKRASSAIWEPVRTAAFDPPPPQQLSSNADIYTELSDNILASPTPDDKATYWQNDPPPTTSSAAAIWFDNNDGHHPHRLVGHAWVDFDGQSYNGGGAYWEWTDFSAWGPIRATRAYIRTSAQPAPAVNQGDYLLHTDTGRVFIFNGSTFIIAGSSFTPGRFGANATGGTVTANAGELIIKGKTSTAFVKEFRFPVDPLADDTYDLRVTRMTPENTDESFFDVQWESFQEVTGNTMLFPGLATSQITARATDQFSSIPDLSGVYKGRLVKIPVNYNPVTRVYDGVWDGTWKIDYTDNPAFIVNDLVENDRYGLNAYYPVVLNKYDVYEAGQWCDTLTTDLRPRFTFNSLIDTPRSCREAIDFICGTFGGRFFDDGNGSANIRIDNDRSASGLFTAENVEDGIFTYAFTENAGRHNDITVVFKNPDLNYQEDRRRVADEDHIATFGRTPLNFIAVGCNSAAEAIIRGRYKLVTGLSETTIVSFRTNRQALYHVPYDIILIADPDMNFGMSGRVKAITDTNKFTTREDIFLETGVNYKVIFQIPDGAGAFTLVERNITPGTSGAITEIPLTATIPAQVIVDGIFSIATTNSDSVPKPFRITNIAEIDGDPDKVEVQAIEVNRLKWSFIDGEIEDYENPTEYKLEIGGKPYPVPNIRIRSYTTYYGTTKVYNLSLDWDPSPTKTVSHYKIMMAKDNGPFTVISDASGLSFEINDVQPGEYVFSIVAISDVSDLPESSPKVIEHRFVGDYSDPAFVTNLRLVNESTIDEYTKTSAQFGWDPVLDPDHSHYVVRIYDLFDTLVHEYTTQDTFWTYEYNRNAIDHSGTAVRAFKIGVASQNQFNRNSLFNILEVDNPVPGEITPVLTPGIMLMNIQWNTDNVPDYAGAHLWVDVTPGFTPSIVNLVYSGSGNSYVFTGLPDTTYYAKMAIYDTFNNTEYDVGPEVSFELVPVDLGDAINGLDDAMDYITGWGPDYNLQQRLADLEQRIEDGYLYNANSQFLAWENHQSLNRSIEVQGAKFTELIQVSSGSLEAIAAQIVILEAEIGDNAAAITNESVARVSADGALASTQVTLATQLDDYSASGLAGFQVGSTPAGATARYAVVLRTSTLASFVEAGLYIDILTGGATRAAIKADQFVIVNGSGVYLDTPFFITGGNVFIKNALITNLTASNIAANAITSTQIAAGAVTATKISVANLEAVSATLGNVAINGNLIVTGTITTNGIASQAVTAVDITGASGSAMLSTAEQTWQAINFQTNNGMVLVDVNFYIGWNNVNSSAFGNIVCRLRKNGTQVDARTIFVDDSWTGLQSWPFRDASPGTGVNTYSFTAQATSSAQTLEHFISQAVIRCTAGKR